MKQKLSTFVILVIDVFGVWLSFGIAIIFKNLLYGDYIFSDIGKYQGLVYFQTDLVGTPDSRLLL